MAAMGAKFIHPMELACPKNPVAIRNAIAAMMRRSAGIIWKNLSVQQDMQRGRSNGVLEFCFGVKALPHYSTAPVLRSLRPDERLIEPRFAAIRSICVDDPALGSFIDSCD